MKVINNNDNSCTMWCFLKGFLIFCVIAAICLLSIVVTWMSGEMSDLREKLKSGQYFGFLQIFINLNPIALRTAKLFGVLTVLSAIGFKWQKIRRHHLCLQNFEKCLVQGLYHKAQAISYLEFGLNITQAV